MYRILQRSADLLDRQQEWSPLLLRLPIGAVFILAGWPKLLMGPLAFKADIPLGNVLGPIVPIVEFGGGILLLLGFGTRAWAFFLAWVMIFAISFVHIPQGFPMRAEIVDQGGRPTAVPMGWAFQAILLAGCLTLLIQGGGALSLDRLISRLCARTEETRPPAG